MNYEFLPVRCSLDRIGYSKLNLKVLLDPFPSLGWKSMGTIASGLLLSLLKLVVLLSTRYYLLYSQLVLESPYARFLRELGDRGEHGLREARARGRAGVQGGATRASRRARRRQRRAHLALGRRAPLAVVVPPLEGQARLDVRVVEERLRCRAGRNER